MEGDIRNFIKVWLWIFVSLCYCYGIRHIVPKGTKRLIFVLPIVALFFYLPLNMSSAHLGGITSFFIAWLANFKLILFALDKGPLASDPHISLPIFIAVSCLPIKVPQISPQKTHINGKIEKSQSQKPSPNGQTSDNTSRRKLRGGPLNYAIKVLLFAILVRLHDYSDQFHHNLTLISYCLLIYVILEIVLAFGAAVARIFLGLELEPQFNAPYLSTSLQDFWGKRWNLMVTSILRPSVYEPILSISTRVMCRKWAPLPAVLGTFLVSGVMHEVMFYHLGRMRPTWYVTWFFLLHGLCVIVEIALKKMIKGRCRVPKTVSAILTVGFVIVTGVWLFVPKFVECKIDVRAFEEYATIGVFVKNIGKRTIRAFTKISR